MNDFRTILLSSLVKVFSDEPPTAMPIVGLTALKNERISYQLAYMSTISRDISFRVKSPLSSVIHLYTVHEIDSCSGAYANQDDYTLRREKSKFPDLLTPVKGGALAPAGKWQSLWIEIVPDKTLEPGKHSIVIDVIDGESVLENVTFLLEVIDAELPPQTLMYTNWFHTDCLANYYHVEVFSEEYWRIVENYLAYAVRHGMTAVLTPLFTPPLDTRVGGERLTVQLVEVTKDCGIYSFDFSKLQRWVEMCDRCGVQQLEMSHFFTQWGAKHAPKIVARVNGKLRKIFGWSTRAAGKRYGEFMDAFAVELKKFIKGAGLENRCIFHVSDEPGKQFLKHYSQAAAMVKRNYGDFPVVDALSDYEFYGNGLIQLPIPANDHIDKFIGKVPLLWTYYCCAQHKNYVANRFFNMPSQRNRVLGYQMYKYDVKGFLHWGYNYWYTRFSIREIDPYKITDAGGAFSAGDSFVVYPATDGSPLSSLRLKVFYEALQDMRAMQLLSSLTSHEKAMAIIEEDGEITFSKYPHSDEWLLNTRERINRAIEAAGRVDNNEYQPKIDTK